MGFFSKKEKDEFFTILEQETQKSSSKKPQYAVPTHAITPDEILSDEGAKGSEVQPQGSPLQSLKKRMRRENTEEDKTTLLDRVRAYTTDEDGNDAAENNDPIYKLESVAEIIRRKNDDLLDRLSSKFEISVDDLGKIEEEPEPEKAEQVPAEEPEKSQAVIPEEHTVPEPTEAFEKMVSDAAARDASQFVFEELFPSSQVLTHEDLSNELPDISDIDNRVLEKDNPTAPADTATIKFTPIKSESGGQGHISISSTTRPIDITGELASLSPETEDAPAVMQLEENEFDAFVPEDEYRSKDDTKRLIRSLSIKQRSAFLRTVFTGLMAVLLVLFLIPPLSTLFVAHTRVCTCICLGLTLVATLINADIFVSLKNLFSNKCTGDTLAALSSVGTAVLGITAIIKEADVTEMLLLLALILFARAISSFWNANTHLCGLRQIASPHPKKAVRLIDDRATTFAMAKNAVEGDVLAAAGQETEFVSNYMKYSSFGTKLFGRIPIVFFSALVLSIFIGLAAGYYFDDSITGLSCAVAILSMAAAPTLFFIDTLPIMTASKKLNRNGAMIAGNAAAAQLELANATVISSNDIFPDGTVTLHSIKVLSDNDIDNTILRAASLTEALGSTLAPIFKRIVGTNASYVMPDSDTVKYEERLGLSGWVDNELLFIGNRTLMEAHGIEVPSIEVDRKILRQGYFPVYLASGDRACALVIIQYSVSPTVAKELRRITNLGITLLVNNCDPNISEAMICDYIGLYDDSVKIMTNAGVHMYHEATVKTEKCSAPASYRGSAINLISILNFASRIKRSSVILTVCYILAMCLGALFFAYTAFTGQSTPPQGATILIYQIIVTALSLALFFTQKP